MTDRPTEPTGDRVPPPVGPETELVSAFVDGETSAEDALRVAADAALTAQAQAFRELSERIGTPPPIDDADRDALISRALEASPSADSGVVDLGTARRRRRWATAIGAAAAVLVALMMLPALLGGSRGNDADTSGDLALTPASTTTPASSPSAARAESAPAAGSDVAPAPTTTASKEASTSAQTDSRPGVGLGGALSGTSEPASPSFAPGPNLPDEISACEDSIRSTMPDLGVLHQVIAFAGPSATYAVFAYEAPPASASTEALRLITVTLPDCTVTDVASAA